MLKKIQSHELKVGMYLHGLCGSWMNHPFWRSKFVIKDKHDVSLILEAGIIEVWIDSSKGLDVDPVVVFEEQEMPLSEQSPDQEASLDLNPIASKLVSVEEEIKFASKLCKQSKAAVVSMFNEVRMGKAIDAEAAGGLVDEITASVSRNPNALLSLARLKHVDDYTYMHSVAVCALMVAVAKQLKMNEAQVREAGMAGLLHDIGKAMMPVDVLNKPGKLTDEEFTIIKQHPVEGHRMLVEGNSVGEIPLDVCLHHHEKMDGTGYPQGLKGDEISIYAKMGAVCDVYDAITSNRPYKAGWDPAESIRRMMEWSGAHFDQNVFKAFVKSVGIYPIGSLVKLRSGRLALVIDQTPESLLKPKVKVFYSTKSNLRLTPEVVDLSKTKAQDKIVSIEDSEKWNFTDLNVLWGGVEFL